MSRLQNRNVRIDGRRTSLRLEPELWEALADIAQRTGRTVHQIVEGIPAAPGERTSSVRVAVLQFYREHGGQPIGPSPSAEERAWLKQVSTARRQQAAAHPEGH